jgi:DNA-binding SARP family transcriptional activator
MDFRLLGPLEVTDGQKRPSVIGGPRQRILLAVLLLHANEVVSADRLAASMWGERPPPTWAKSLQVHVSRLRAELGAERLTHRPPGYVLHVGPDELDLARFERLVARAGHTAPEQAAALLREALGLWRGEPLDDLAYEDFAQPHLARLREARLLALEARIDADLAAGRHAELTGELQALVLEHPLRERLRGQLMLALYRAGRQSDALDAYRAARRTLVGDLGLEPGAALRDLEAAILRHDPALDAAARRAPPSAADEPARFVLAHGGETGLADLCAALARASPGHGVIVTAAVPPADLAAATAQVAARAAALRADGVASRSAAFTLAAPGTDLARLAARHDVDLVLAEADGAPLGGATREVLAEAPCDVALLLRAGGPPRDGPVLVPFGAAEHDWAALELGAWAAKALGRGLRLAGGVGDGRDASRLLADASLVVQRSTGVLAEPCLAEPGRRGLRALAAGAGLLVLGLRDTWAADGLGGARAELVADPPAPTVLVRRGAAGVGITPAEPRTRFGWSLTGALS